MFLKVCALLALASIASANDLNKGLEIMACAQRAISGGVPSLGIPSHDPYVVIKHNFSTNATIAGQHFSADIHSLTWGGLAEWKLSASQLSYDTDKEAVFDFELYWDWLGINGNFTLDEEILFFDSKQKGNFSIDLRETKWAGTINVTKPTAKSNGTVNSVHLDWHVKHVDTKTDGLGLLGKVVETTIGAGIMTSFNTNIVSKTVGDFVKMRLETIWWNTGKVWQLMDWCQSNPATSF